MVKDIESHQRVNKAAKEEFLELGFEKASMRSIGKKAGMTQAALYKHYKSKEDMFSSLVEPAIKAIEKASQEHKKAPYRHFEEEVKKEGMFKNNSIKILKRYLYKYPDEFRLLLCCSQGTKYETFVHDLVVQEQKSTSEAIRYLKKNGIKVKNVTDDELHIILSAYVSALFEPVRHNWDINKAKKGLDILDEFFTPGWKNILGFE